MASRSRLCRSAFAVLAPAAAASVACRGRRGVRVPPVPVRRREAVPPRHCGVRTVVATTGGGGGKGGGGGGDGRRPEGGALPSPPVSAMAAAFKAAAAAAEAARAPPPPTTPASTAPTKAAVPAAKPRSAAAAAAAAAAARTGAGTDAVTDAGTDAGADVAAVGTDAAAAVAAATPRRQRKARPKAPPPPPRPLPPRVLVVGLGNPGATYSGTRHNVGFAVLDAYAARHGAAFRPARGLSADVAVARVRLPAAAGRVLAGSDGGVGGAGGGGVGGGGGGGGPPPEQTLYLLKPTTFMNRSGTAVGAAMRYYKLPPSAVVVVADDMALPVGAVRVREKGSAGGHNGLKSIQAALGGSPDYARFKVGVGAPRGGLGNGEAWAGHVLGKLSRGERETIEDVTWDTMDALDRWVAGVSPSVISEKLARK